MFLASYITLWVFVLILFVAVLLLYRHIGRKLVSSKAELGVQGPRVDERVSVSLETIDGQSVDVGPGKGARVIAFTAPRCPACARIPPILNDVLAGGRVNGRDLVIVYHGDPKSARDYVEKIPRPVFAVADPERALSQLWQVTITPFFVITDSDGVVRKKGLGTSRQQIESLMGVAG